MLISIIIPVYNVENYLKECINSVLEQKFKDYEIILVNDGSRDNGGKICDEYSKKYSFISTIHKENGGLSEARNFGLRIAKGEYILFIDSDDYIAKESLSVIAEKILLNKKIDLIFLDAIKFYPDGKIIPMNDGYKEKEINGKSKDEVMKYLAKLSKFPGSACTKLISNRLIQENKLYFKKGILSEDIDWTIRLLKVAENFLYIEMPYYYYRQNREGSITNTISLKKLECNLLIIEKYSSKNLKLNYQQEINSFMAYEFVIALYNYGLLTPKEKKLIINKLKKNKWILKYSNLNKIKFIKFFINIFGIENVAKILNIYKNFLTKIEKLNKGENRH